MQYCWLISVSNQRLLIQAAGWRGPSEATSPTAQTKQHRRRNEENVWAPPVVLWGDICLSRTSGLPLHFCLFAWSLTTLFHDAPILKLFILIIIIDLVTDHWMGLWRFFFWRVDTDKRCERNERRKLGGGAGGVGEATELHAHHSFPALQHQEL